MRTRRALAALLALPALALSACGDDETNVGGGADDRPATTTSATAPEVATPARDLPEDEAAASRVGRFRANALTECANAGGQGKAIGAPPEDATVVAWARNSLSITQGRRRVLEEIEPPRSEAKRVRALVRGYGPYLDLLSGVASIEDGDRKRAASAAKVVAGAAADLQRQASKLGVATCGPLA